jgi:hypothetical protein
MVESFWAVPDSATLRTPLSILREQASALTEQTKGAIVGSVETRTDNGTLDVHLTLIVPALNDYRHRILTYKQPIDLYPGHLVASGQEMARFIEISDENQFVSEVKGILSSDRTKNILTSLLAQVVEA